MSCQRRITCIFGDVNQAEYLNLSWKWRQCWCILALGMILVAGGSITCMAGGESYQRTCHKNSQQISLIGYFLFTCLCRKPTQMSRTLTPASSQIRHDTTLGHLLHHHVICLTGRNILASLPTNCTISHCLLVPDDTEFV